MEGVNVIRTAVIKTCKLQFPYKNPNLLDHDKDAWTKGGIMLERISAAGAG